MASTPCRFWLQWEGIAKLRNNGQAQLRGSLPEPAALEGQTAPHGRHSSSRQLAQRALLCSIHHEDRTRHQASVGPRLTHRNGARKQWASNQRQMTAPNAHDPESPGQPSRRCKATRAGHCATISAGCGYSAKPGASVHPARSGLQKAPQL